MYRPFVFNSVLIVDATSDETGYLRVDPITYDGAAWQAAQLDDLAQSTLCTECRDLLLPGTLYVCCAGEQLHSHCVPQLLPIYPLLPLGLLLQGSTVPAAPAAIQLAAQAVLAAGIALADSWAPSHSLLPDGGNPPLDLYSALLATVQVYQCLTGLPPTGGDGSQVT